MWKSKPFYYFACLKWLPVDKLQSFASNHKTARWVIHLQSSHIAWHVTQYCYNTHTGVEWSGTGRNYISTCLYTVYIHCDVNTESSSCLLTPLNWRCLSHCSAVRPPSHSQQLEMWQHFHCRFCRLEECMHWSWCSGQTWCDSAAGSKPPHPSLDLLRRRLIRHPRRSPQCLVWLSGVWMDHLSALGEEEHRAHDPPRCGRMKLWQNLGTHLAGEALPNPRTVGEPLVCAANTTASAGTGDQGNFLAVPSHPHLSHTAAPGHWIDPAT
jgi:hypothetical protein